MHIKPCSLFALFQNVKRQSYPNRNALAKIDQRDSDTRRQCGC